MNVLNELDSKFFNYTSKCCARIKCKSFSVVFQFPSSLRPKIYPYLFKISFLKHRKGITLSTYPQLVSSNDALTGLALKTGLCLISSVSPH